ncbi:hypothetical protein Glove_658g2 [Diversispora epigaea]|uniref:Uncharacterized protein n=1 Tax=Diversispora epigaea TaxID=1348612 RepID=A0A397G558_9GLOM|nr:hypothetical protein Glove_658g2 [Diversispora epigaea]
MLKGDPTAQHDLGRFYTKSAAENDDWKIPTWNSQTKNTCKFESGQGHKQLDIIFDNKNWKERMYKESDITTEFGNIKIENIKLDGVRGSWQETTQVSRSLLG